MVVAPDNRTAYVSGEADGSVYRVALPSGAPAMPLLQLHSGARPMGVALDAASGRLYVTTGRGGTVAVISIADQHLIGEVAAGARPWGVALTGHGTRLLTANGPGGDLAVIDTRTLAVLGRVPTGHGSWGVVAEP